MLDISRVATDFWLFGQNAIKGSLKKKYDIIKALLGRIYFGRWLLLP